MPNRAAAGRRDDPALTAAMTRDLRSEDSALLIPTGLPPAKGVNQIFSRPEIPLRLDQVRSCSGAVVPQYKAADPATLHAWLEDLLPA
jgi:hypothetical protein